MVGNGIRPQVASADQRFVKRLLCAECGDSEADFSRDGRQMVFTDWDSGDLAIRDMSAGKVKRLLAKTGGWDNSVRFSGAYGETPVFSPNLRQIVYYWNTGEKDLLGQLRLMPNEPGGKSRILLGSPENDYYAPTAWFPDGKSVLVMLQKTDRSWQLVRVSVADGAVKVLKSLDQRWYGTSAGPKVSPDGKFIVYDALAVNPTKIPPAPTDSKDRHLYVLAADGSSETEIVKTSGTNRSPVWTLDGKHVLFNSDRSGKTDLWSIAIENGKAAGPVSLVSADVGDTMPAGMRGGSYYYTQRSQGIEYVSLVGMNQDRTTESFVGTTPMWSPDGKSISLKRHHPNSTNTANLSDLYDLVIHSFETGEERTYTSTLDSTGGGGAFWTHDGKSVLEGCSRTGDSKRWIYRIDLKSGDFEQLPVPLSGGGISRDDTTFYQVDADPADGRGRIVAVNIKGGQPGQAFKLPYGGQVAARLSPEDKMIAIMRDDTATSGQTRHRHVGLVSVDGSNYRDVFTGLPSELRPALAWANDGRAVLFCTIKDDRWRILRIPVTGGAPEFTGFEGTGSIQGFDISPDGSRIAYSSLKRVQEVWALDSVLSAVQ
jgi:Tol biopolymer transport system component